MAHSTDTSRVLKCDDTFLVADHLGEIGGDGSEHGLYHAGTRHVSCLRVRLDERSPLLLSSSVFRDNLVLNVNLTNPDLFRTAAIDTPHGSQSGGSNLVETSADAPGALAPLPASSAEENEPVRYATLHVARSMFLENAAYLERIVVWNHSNAPVRFRLVVEFAADFADLFEVRGNERKQRGQLLPPEVGTRSTTLRYRGLDDVVRTTQLFFNPEPVSLSESRACFDVALGRHESLTLSLRIGCHAGFRQPASLLSYEDAVTRAALRVERSEAEQCSIETSNEHVNRWLERSRADLRMLTTSTRYGPYPYAGVPWFSAPFGRDGIWTALETLWIDPLLARGVLRFLSAHQAREVDIAADAEPGKILHEMREGEMPALGEVPFGRYYGSVDSTPLYLMLAGEYYRATGDSALIEELWPHLLQAVDWMENYGDCDGDGFLEYGCHQSAGLVNQGWKDSHDSVFHRNGSNARGPIALVEVQGYAYRAFVAMAELDEKLKRSGSSSRWRARAEVLRKRFDDAFWRDDLDCYALALDGKKLPCDVVTSNAGHCLYSGIALPERISVLARRLMARDMFSGWGVRTLSSREERYNPLSYHNGSVWPHDTAIIAEGLALNGHRQAALELFSACFHAALFMPLQRLPELFCGFQREPQHEPTRYPVACIPQAWAAGAAFLLLKAALGLHVDALERCVTLHHPQLPPFIEEMKIRRLPVGEGTVDLQLVRHPEDVGLIVTRTTVPVQVVVVK